MWELDYKESWVPKNWCFWTLMLGKTFERPLDCKEIHPVHPKGNQSWIFIGRTDAEAETIILWPPDGKNWLIGKDPDAGEDWQQEVKGTTEDEMVGWHHRLDGHEFEQAPGVGDGQGGLACCSPRGCKELDTPEWLNWTKLHCNAGDLISTPWLGRSPGEEDGNPLQYFLPGSIPGLGRPHMPRGDSATTEACVSWSLCSETRSHGQRSLLGCSLWSCKSQTQLSN